MTNIRLISVIITVLLLPVLASAADREAKEYTVIKGDTLWGIAHKELNDSFLWPKVWKENADIKNPDRLYPGQIVKIPYYLMQKERERQEQKPASSAAVALPAATVATATESSDKGRPAAASTPSLEKLQPVASSQLMAACGYIAEAVPAIGTVTGSPSKRIVFGNSDVVYVSMQKSAKIGDRFYIVRAENRVRHPLSGKDLGFIVEVLGVAEITQFEYGETKAKITEMYNDIVVGDRLVPYFEIVAPVTSGRRPSIDATVVTSRNFQLLSGNFDIIYIDKGERDGVEIGDLFRTVDVSEHKIPNGVIQIIGVRSTTATAVVREISDLIGPGNLVTKLE